MNTIKIEDQNERQQAVFAEHSVIIQAPAGSGKTELLIQRYLRLLALVDEPEEIIAITFTRKAAAEMRDRIIAALISAQQGIREAQKHQRITQEIATAVLQRSTTRNWNITDNPGRLRIQTIDSLSASLARQLPISSRLGAQLEIVDDADPLYQQAATNTLAVLEEDLPHAEEIAVLLAYMDNDLPRLQALTVTMLKKRDQWLRYITKTHDRKGLERVLKNIIEASLEQLRAQFSVEHAAELCQVIRYAAQNLKQHEKSAIRHCISMRSLPEGKLKDQKKWLGIAEFMLTKENKWRKLFNKNQGFPAKSGDGSISKEMKERAKDLIFLLSGEENIRQHLLTIKILPAPGYTEGEWKITKALCAYLLLAEAQLRLCFAEHGQIDYIGITQAAITALGKEGAPTDLALYLDYQIRHLLVDEFQDISLNQQQLLLALCNGWSADEGRSLFLVGDPMQSIYRFREAEVNIFTNTFQQRRFGQLPLTALKLSTNFRSAAAVIGWINDCFSKIFPPKNELHTGAVAYTPSVAINEEKAAGVHVYPFFANADTLEAQAVLDIINKIKTRQKGQGITILVRNRAHIVTLISLLKKANIAVHAVEIASLGQQPAIQDLLALARAYMHPADRIAWLAVLRAPWCGLRLRELHALIHDSKKTVWELINDHTRKQQLEQDAQTRLKRLIDCFNAAFSWQYRQPFCRIIETLWVRLGGPAALTIESELDQVTAFFELIAQIDVSGNIEQMERFTKQVQQLFATPDHDTKGAVQIMTIHKAKGLEFDHVIIPGLGHGQKQRENELLIWMVQSDQRYGNSLLLAPIKEIGVQAKKNTLYEYINHIERQKQAYEEVRLLYVAATRAKIALHLLGHARLKKRGGKQCCAPVKNTLLYHLWPAVGQYFKDTVGSKPGPAPVTPSPIAPKQCHRLDIKWQRPAPEKGAVYTEKYPSGYDSTAQKMIEYRWAGALIRHVGSVVHHVLQQIATQGLRHWDTTRVEKNTTQFIAALKQYGVPKDELNEGCRLICEALNKTLDDRRGRWILDENHREKHNEYRLSGMYNNKLIHIAIDRTFIDRQHKRWIIDYKTSRHLGGDRTAFLDQEQKRHQQQLIQYGTLMRAMGDAPVWLGLYFPLLQGWRAWEL